MPTQITTHIEDAQARLRSQYQDAEMLNHLLAAILGPIQNLEDTVFQIMGATSITTAYGAQLDTIGGLVGVARVAGQTDSQYLLSIYGQIGVNRSAGTAKDVISAFLVYTGATDCIIHAYYPAEFYIQTTYVFSSESVKQATAAFIQSVAGIGIRFGGFTNTPTVIQFAFDGPQVGDVSDGFGDVNDSTAGGFWADVNDTDPDPGTI